MNRMRSVLLFILLISITACGAPYEFKGVLLDEPRAVHDVSGTDENGAPFLLSDYRGQYVLLNFGYTFCPDICPLTLAELAHFHQNLVAEDSELAQQVQIAFVTVDPERDTVERLNAYVHAFDPTFHGVNIALPEELELTKQSFGVFSEQVPIEGNPDGYLVNHTGGIFVVNPDGQWVLFLPHDAPAEDILADIVHLLKK